MMNMVSLVLVAIVAFTYFGGQNVPKVLKDNKQMILGVFVGVLLHQFMGIGVEGWGEKSSEWGKWKKESEAAWSDACLDCTATTYCVSAPKKPSDVEYACDDLCRGNPAYDGDGGYREQTQAHFKNNICDRQKIILTR